MEFHAKLIKRGMHFTLWRHVYTERFWTVFFFSDKRLDCCAVLKIDFILFPNVFEVPSGTQDNGYLQLIW